MDETPIEAGLQGPRKRKQGYFWPVYGERDEICFPYCESRRAEHVDQLLGLKAPPGAVLITDGYAAYSRYEKKTEGLTHAQCWAHTRRAFFESQAADPQRAAVALEMIGNLYAVEAEIRDRGLKGAKKQEVRLTKAKPLVEAFFTWVVDTAADTGLLPSNPMSKALAYAHKRRAGLEVFLSDADVPIDTNHLESAASRNTSVFKSKFQSLVRRGYQRAIIAIGHQILRTIFFMLKRREHYRDSATDYEALSVQRNTPR